MKEEWLNVKGFEGLYMVSSLGRVKSIRYERNKLLSSCIDNLGYMIVGLCDSGIQRTSRVHRLVALAFIPNPENKPMVNHIDEVKSNNNVGNLEWATAKENMNHGTAIERRKLSMANRLFTRNYSFIKINQLTSSGVIVDSFNGTTEVANAGFDRSHVLKCCKRMEGFATHKGYKWRFDEVRKLANDN
jgi:hypothetical protein